MAGHRGPGSTVALLAVAVVPLLASACACMYGACAGSVEYLEYNGQLCPSLEGSGRGWHALGSEGTEPHQWTDGQDYYVTCFTYPGKKGTALSVLVESSEFEPEIHLRREGRNQPTLASGAGARSARVSVTLPENGRYAVIVTSKRPRDTGRFDLRFSTSSR